MAQVDVDGGAPATVGAVEALEAAVGVLGAAVVGEEPLEALLGLRAGAEPLFVAPARRRYMPARSRTSSTRPTCACSTSRCSFIVLRVVELLEGAQDGQVARLVPAQVLVALDRGAPVAERVGVELGDLAQIVRRSSSEARSAEASRSATSSVFSPRRRCSASRPRRASFDDGIRLEGALEAGHGLRGLAQALLVGARRARGSARRGGRGRSPRRPDGRAPW